MRDREFKITKAEEGAAFAVHVVPKAVKNEVVGKYGDALKIHLTSNNVGGTASCHSTPGDMKSRRRRSRKRRLDLC